MSDWQNFKGGARWRYLQDGRLVFQQGLAHVKADSKPYFVLDKDGAIRTRGEPASAKQLRAEYGARIIAAATRFKLSPALIASVILCESGKLANSFSRDPISIRFERNYIDDEATPNQVSAGLMQTLLSTARSMCRETKWSPLDPSTGRPREFIRQDMYIAENSLFLGSAYLRNRADDNKTTDILLLHGAYNAGDVRYAEKLELNILAFGGDHRFAKAGAYYNDWLAAGGEL